MSVLLALTARTQSYIMVMRHTLFTTSLLQGDHICPLPAISKSCANMLMALLECRQSYWVSP